METEGVIEIIPGILEKEWEAIERKIELVLPFATSIHIDLLDGKFAPNTTFMDPKPFAKYTNTVTFELHMMVEEPIDYLEPWANAGFRRFIGQIEHMTSQTDFVAKAQQLGDVGLGIDSQTPIEKVGVPLNDLDFLFVMTVKAGFSNQPFLSESLKKVSALRSKTSLPIEVDGGINNITIAQAVEAGATRFVSTGFLFGSESPQTQFEVLHQSCQRV